MRKSFWMVGIIGIAALALFVLAEGKRDIYKGSVEDRVETLAKIQPGLGTVMIEYGNRFTNTYYAAKGGNWGMAQYQLKEAREIQEVGEVTRPGRAPMLRNFEHGYLDALEKTIEAKDWSAFESQFKASVTGCNACHAANGFAFVQYVLPDKPAMNYVNFNLKTDPKVK